MYKTGQEEKLIMIVIMIIIALTFTEYSVLSSFLEVGIVYYFHLSTKEQRCREVTSLLKVTWLGCEVMSQSSNRAACLMAEAEL